MTYQLPEPTQLFCDAWFHSDEQIQTALRDAYVAGQRDMREAAAKVCTDIEYTGWKGEYMSHGPETDANEEFRKCGKAIQSLPIETI